MTINVKLSGSYGDPRPLSMDIRNALKAGAEEIANIPFKVWIERDYRR